jgi:hypothetical protein
MSKTEFTEGPWEKDNKNNIVGKNNTIVIRVCDLTEDKEQLANNNLIAAAPDMYAMLDDLLRNYEIGLEVDNRLDVLLAKARGEFTEEASLKLIAIAPEMYLAMQKFINRVDKGEVRSKATYEEFKSILNKLNDNHIITREEW